jgi:hypothetical protein
MRLSQVTQATLLGSAVLSVAGLLTDGGAIAQTLSSCQPPRANEYLLLVRNQKSETQARLQQLLPANAVLTPCSYLNDSVVRVEGFASNDIASAWSKYLNDVAGLQVFVTGPSTANASTPIQTTTSPTSSAGGTSSPPTPITPASAARPAGSTYNPQPLGSGYAVLVNYFNRPEIAANVRQITAREVGLVAYNQQPYLLATHTTDAATASAVLRALTERGLTATIVDSRGAVLLTTSVASAER